MPIAYWLPKKNNNNKIGSGEMVGHNELERSLIILVISIDVHTFIFVEPDK